MSTTSSPDSRSEWRATVSVRIPPSDGDDLATSAGRRLQRDDDVADATVEHLRGLDPAMPATVVTVDVRLEAARTLDERAVANRLTAAPGDERVETVRPA
jgi:NMD protein affecting ribosome stability and mRNA decay